MLNGLKRNYQYLILAILWLSLTGITCYYLYLNRTPLSFDASGYLEVSGAIGHALNQLNLFQALKIFIHHDTWNNRPALYMFVGGIFAVFTRFNIFYTVLLSNMFWFGALCLLTYLIAENCRKNSGLLAVFMLVSSYGIIYMYRNFLSDVPLAVGVLWCIYTFIKYRQLSVRKWLYMYGLALILGALLKETFALYAFSIFLYHLMSEWKQARVSSHKGLPYLTFMQFIYFYLAVIALVSLFYLPIISNLLKNMLDNVGNDVGQYYARSFTKGSFNYYFVYIYLLSLIVSICYFILPGVILLVDLLLNKVFKSDLYKFDTHWLSLLSVTCFIPAFVLTCFVVDTDNRFLIPILPLLLIIVAALVINLHNSVLKLLAIGCLFVVGVANFISSIYYIPWLPQNITYGNVILFAQRAQDDANGLRYGVVNANQDWKIHNILEAIYKDSKYEHSDIACLNSMIYLNTNILRSYAVFNYPNLNFYGFDSINALEYASYIVTTTSKLTDDPKLNVGKVAEINRYIFKELSAGKYQLLEKYLLPNNDYVYVIKKHKGTF